MSGLVGAHLDALLLSLPGGFFWLWYVMRKSRVHPPPVPLVLAAYALGMLAPWGVLWVDVHLPGLLAVGANPRFLVLVAYYVGMVGLLEEGCKLLGVRLTVYYARSFDDCIHGVVYSSAAALGFATVENARYVDAHGVEVMLGRIVLSTFGHVLQSMIWGFAMGVQRTAHRRGGGWGVLASGWLLAGVIHGVYDLLLVYDQMWLALLLLFVLWRVFLEHVDEAARKSPFRVRVSRRVRECEHCSGLVRGEGRYCGACGELMEAPAGALCAVCLQAVDPADASCRSCGCRLLPQAPAGEAAPHLAVRPAGTTTGS